MKHLVTVENALRLGKVVAEVCVAIIAYETVHMHPVLIPGAVGLAVVGTVFAAIWVMGMSSAKFPQTLFVIRAPFVGLLLAFTSYAALQLLVFYIDLYPPSAKIGPFADLLIQFLFALIFIFLGISICSLLRGINLNPAQLLQTLNVEEKNDSDKT